MSVLQRRIVFGHRLLVTATGAAIGVVFAIVRIGVDRLDVGAGGVALFVAAGLAAALIGAAATRRLAAAVAAAVLAGIAVPVATVVAVVAACVAGAPCD